METDDAGSELNLPEDNTSVRVALRIRPPLPREIIEGCKTCTTVAEGHPQVWIGSNHAFTFDYVFDQNSPQNIIFDNVVKKLLDGCLHGYNATILAYGQTGSGKTYTMGTGFEFDPSADSQGIIPRAVTYLFSQVDKIRKECAAAKADFKIEVQFVELYNEEVVDLLSTTDRPTSAGAPYRPNSANSIRIHEDSSGSIYLVGVQTLAVGSCHETLKVLREGALSRTTASTNMNDTSSRSHAIFTMHVTQTRVSTEFGEAELETLSAKFHFVDLAGSERLKRTLATGDRAKEGISINCGLLALGNVISALGDRNKKGNHVPYRDSKLTRLLQDSLGGNSRTIMIACVSPSDTDFVETLNTLKYANRAKNIKNRIQINQDKSSRTISSLRREIEMLTSELLEYKQGKRQATATSDYSDTHQENILLLTELDSLKSRLKSKQESIDKLTCTVATYETQNELKNLADTDCDLTKMVQKYLLEIEDLRTKLYESEQECEKLRSKQRRLNTSLCSPRQNHLDPAVNNGLLQDARAEIENDKKKLEKISAKSSENDDDDDGSSDSDDTDSEQQEKFEEIAQLTSEISIKELLIDQLEQSHRRVESLKHHYEEKLECLNNKIKATQEERDKVMASLKSGKRSAQVDADYEKKISAMQMEAKKWQQAQKEHVKLVRNQSQYERQIDKLKNEVESLKQIKVKLLRQSKVESAKYRDLEMKRQKEIMSLKKAQRVKDIKLKTLENEKIMKDQVLKRKLEEVNSLKRINRIQMSRKAQGKARPNGSPLKAKSKWSTLQNEIRKSVSIKTTVSSLEKEMLNLIQERTEARKKLKELENIVIKDEFIQEDIESIRTNLAFLEERITEIQNQIAEISSGIKEYDGSELDEVEIQYVFKKVFEMNISNLTEAERSERRIDDLEETNKQLNKEISSLRSLLQYMYNRNNNSSGSGPCSSGLSNEQMDEFNEMPTTIANTCPSVDSMTTSYNSKLRKARRLTSTPQELLGSLENVSTTKSEFLNPNEMVFGNAFTRNSRQTQSLRVNSNTTKRRPQLLRQDTYNVGDKKFQEAPEKLLADQPGKSSNNADNFNTTFLVEQKSPPSSTSLSSSASNNKLTNSIDVNNTCDSPNNVGKGFIRRVSSNLMNKDRVLTITHTMGGHSKPVISMSATDNKLFTGSKDSTAKELDLETGNELRSYVGHPSNVTCVKYIDETQLLLTASGSLVKIWDTRTKNCIKTLMSSGAAVDKAQSNFESRLLQPGETQIQSIALLRNFLLTTFDCRIRAWDLRKLQSSLGILAGKHSANIMCLTTAQDVKIKNDYRDFIVSGSKDHYLKLYELRPDQPTQTIQPKGNLIPPHYDGIESLLIKNTDLYSGSRDMCIKKWDLSTGEMICTAANAHSGWITGLSRLPDEYNLDYVMSSSRDGSVKVWDSSLKEVNRTDISMTSSSNYCVESICVNKRLVFTAGGSTSNSNSTTTSNGIISDYGVQIWTIRDDLRNNNNGKQSSPPS